MGWIDGWDGMVIIDHRCSKSTFSANKRYRSNTISYQHIGEMRPARNTNGFQ